MTGCSPPPNGPQAPPSSSTLTARAAERRSWVIREVLSRFLPRRPYSSLYLGEELGEPVLGVHNSPGRRAAGFPDHHEAAIGCHVVLGAVTGPPIAREREQRPRTPRIERRARRHRDAHELAAALEEQLPAVPGPARLSPAAVGGLVYRAHSGKGGHHHLVTLPDGVGGVRQPSAVRRDGNREG